MRTPILSACAACALALPAWAQQPTADTATRPAAADTMPKASPQMVERMQALREAHLARTAVYDRTEQAFRAPTDQERAALSAGARAPTPTAAVTLPNGTVALRGVSGELSFLMAETRPDGSTAIRHADGTPERPAFARPPHLTAPAGPVTTAAKEVRHAR